MGRHVPTPFHLALIDDGAEAMLRVDTILRIVPGKRIVALCNWKNHTVIAKIFYRRAHWKQSILRDLRGITALREASIPTPKVISQNSIADQNGAVLLIEYLKHANNLLSLFEDANSDAERHGIMAMGVGAIARCHKAGLWQRDIHLGNFMLAADKLYVLDGGDIKGEGRRLDGKTRMQNLAVFFAQFPIAFDIQIPGLLDRYLKAADAAVPGSTGTDSAATLQADVVAVRQKRLQSYERKLFRSSTAHRMLKNRHRFAVYDRTIHSPDIESLIESPDSLLAGAKMLKEGNSSTVAIVQFAGRDFVLKRYNLTGFVHGLKRLFQPSRAHISWRNAAMLEMLGIATPHAFLMIEERVMWLLRRRAWYLCEYVKSENLLEQVAKPDSGGVSVSAVVDRFAQLLKALQTYRISHGDMKASNFIISDERLYVLDLDAMRQHRTERAAQRELEKDRERFRRNWNGTLFAPAVEQMLGELVKS